MGATQLDYCVAPIYVPTCLIGEKMTAKLIDGKAVAKQVREEVKEKVAKRVAAGKPKPGLATVLVGSDPASEVYVGMKKRMCERLGMESFSHTLPADASQDEVVGLVEKLNADPAVNGILVQLPLPDHLDEEKVLQAIDITKDIDGFHPINIGRLAQKGRESLFVPCTPDGCLYLLDSVGAELEGANAVVKNAKPAIEFAPNADPPLNPNQPNHSKAAPNAVSIILIGFIAVLFNPTLRPTKIANTNPAKPPFICTTVPPAKSNAPASNNKAPSPPHTICVIGA